MKNSQFLISSEKIDNLHEEFAVRIFGDYYVYCAPGLSCEKVSQEDVEIMLLGFIIDPFSPQKTNREIISDLSRHKDKNGLFMDLENLSGRYVLIYKTPDTFLILHDMFGQKQINYIIDPDRLIIASSVLQLVHAKGKFEEIPDFAKLQEDKGFVLFDHWLLGDLTYDRQIRKLLPNHYLDLKNRESRRLPFFETERLNEKQVIEFTKAVVEGNYSSVMNRYSIIFQALTAGYDSRTLLALSHDYWDKIRFYTFRRADAVSRRDAGTAKALSKRFGFRYQAIAQPPKNEEFHTWYCNQFILPRTTPKYYNILYFSQFENDHAINLTGDGVQMVRNLRIPEQLDSAETLFKSLKYEPKGYQFENFKNWLEEAKIAAKENNILISDLFTQEIAQGQLTARWAFEFEYSGCEEFNPFNHKKMIYSILKNIPFEERTTPDFRFQKKLMESSVPGITNLTFNPPTWKDKVKRVLSKLSLRKNYLYC